MTAPARPLSDRLREEAGIVVPLTVAVLALVLILVGAAAIGAGFSNDSSNKDRQAKRAQQAADAGVSAALDRMNRLDVTHGAAKAAALQCVGKDGSGKLTLTPATSGTWCPAVTENLGNGESVTYQVRPVTQAAGASTATYSLVVTGTSSGTTRRVIVDATALTGEPLFGENSVVSLDDLNLSNSVLLRGGIRSNGNVKFNNSAHAECPGSKVTTLDNKAVSPASAACAVGKTTTPVVLSPVNVGDARTNNSNGQLCNNGDICNGKKITWNPTTRRLNIDGGSVTLTGSQYVFCQLDMSGNSELLIPETANVKIFIDSPENCGNSPAGQDVGGISFGNNSSVTTGDEDPTSLQIFVVGSPTTGVCSGLPLPSPATCGVRWGNHNTSYLTLYAPYSSVDIDNHIDIIGAVAAKQIVMDNNTAILSHPSVSSITSTDLYPVFKRQGYRECTPTPTSSAPDSGC